MESGKLAEKPLGTLMKRGAGSDSAPVYLDSYFYFINWEGVHRQNRRVYFPCRIIELDGKSRKWGVDKYSENRKLDRKEGHRVPERRPNYPRTFTGS